uniref:Uncharacterized protein n=1 Tax=Pristionchus pacificus TaxID=54126 RepID=A0A2A6CMM8_PRIPA|eukprot:PDM79281.1 hypothetical protein PRIPAC_31860 [Pristionchus pacificus]
MPTTICVRYVLSSSMCERYDPEESVNSLSKLPNTTFQERPGQFDPPQKMTLSDERMGRKSRKCREFEPLEYGANMSYWSVLSRMNSTLRQEIERRKDENPCCSQIAHRLVVEDERRPVDGAALKQLLQLLQITALDVERQQLRFIILSEIVVILK